MTELSAIAAVAASSSLNLVAAPPIATATAVRADAAEGFASILSKGMEAVDRKIGKADALVRQFAVDDSIPVHQVTIAIEEARLSVELAMQVRMRLVEGYRELMNMQL